MPIPLLIGAAVLLTGAYGAKKGYDGYQKHSEADEIVENAKKRYGNQKNKFDTQEKDTQSTLSELGSLELNIGKSFNEFKVMADALIKKINETKENKLEINIPKHQLQKVEAYSYSAIGVLGSAVGAGAAGAAAGFAVYGGVMALGAASTGTAISSLAGAAATNATLAAIGGGSLATGGLGIAGGTAILGAAVAAPVLAIAGWAYNNHGEEALKNAYKADREVDAAVEKLSKSIERLKNIKKYASKIEETLRRNFDVFTKHYFNPLKEIDRQVHFEILNAEDIEGHIGQIISNGFTLASILVNLISTPIFKIKEVNGNPIIDKSGMPEAEKDSDGLMIINKEKIDLTIQETDKEINALLS